MSVVFRVKLLAPASEYVEEGVSVKPSTDMIVFAFIERLPLMYRPDWPWQNRARHSPLRNKGGFLILHFVSLDTIKMVIGGNGAIAFARLAVFVK